MQIVYEAPRSCYVAVLAPSDRGLLVEVGDTHDARTTSVGLPSLTCIQFPVRAHELVKIAVREGVHELHISFRPNTLYTYVSVTGAEYKDVHVMRYTGHVLQQNQCVLFSRVLSENVDRALLLDAMIEKNSNVRSMFEGATALLTMYTTVNGVITSPPTQMRLCSDCMRKLFDRDQITAYKHHTRAGMYPCECAVETLSTVVDTSASRSSRENVEKYIRGDATLPFGAHVMPLALPCYSVIGEDGACSDPVLNVKLAIKDVIFEGSLTIREIFMSQFNGPSMQKGEVNWLSSVQHVNVCRLQCTSDSATVLMFPIELVVAKQWVGDGTKMKRLFIETDKERMVHREVSVKQSFTTSPDTHAVDDYVINGVRLSKHPSEDAPQLFSIPKARLVPTRVKNVFKGATGRSEEQFPLIIGHRGLGSNKIHFTSPTNAQCPRQSIPITPAFRENTIESFSAAFNLEHDGNHHFSACAIETDLQPLHCGRGSNRWTDPECSALFADKDPFCGVKDIAICHEFMAPLKTEETTDAAEQKNILQKSSAISHIFAESQQVALTSHDYSTTEEAAEAKLVRAQNEYSIPPQLQTHAKYRLLVEMSTEEFLTCANDAVWTNGQVQIKDFAHKTPEVDDLYDSVKEETKDNLDKFPTVKKTWLHSFNRRYGINQETMMNGPVPQKSAVQLPVLGSDGSKCFRLYKPAPPITLHMLLSFLKGLHSSLDLFMNLEVKSLCRRMPWSAEYKAESETNGVMTHPPRFAFVNKELQIVAEATDSRPLHIFFSSFDWMTVLLLASQQNTYPVLYLTLGDELSECDSLNAEYEWHHNPEMPQRPSDLPLLSKIDSLDVADDFSDVPVHDPLARVLPYAFALCESHEYGISGVVASVAALLKATKSEGRRDLGPLSRRESVLLTYGSSIRDPAMTSFLFGGLGVDGAIVDGL